MTAYYILIAKKDVILKPPRLDRLGCFTAENFGFHYCPTPHFVRLPTTASLLRRTVLQRIVVLSASPDIAELSPALLDLTDFVFQRQQVAPKEQGTASRTTSVQSVTSGRGESMSTRTLGSSVGILGSGVGTTSSVSHVVTAVS